MGAITGALGSIIGRAADEPDFQAELVSKPREVLERELDRPLSDDELQQAADALKQHGIHVQLTGDDSAGKGH